MISLSPLIGALFLYFVLIEVLKQSKTLTFFIFVMFVFPYKYVFPTAKVEMGNGALTEVISGGQSVKF